MIIITGTWYSEEYPRTPLGPFSAKSKAMANEPDSKEVTKTFCSQKTVKNFVKLKKIIKWSSK